MLKTIKYMYFIHMKVGADDNLMNRRKPLLLISYGDESIKEKKLEGNKRKKKKETDKIACQCTIYTVFTTFFISTCLCVWLV